MIIKKENSQTTPFTHSSREQFNMVAKTMHGLEQVLAKELEDCGATNIELQKRAVAFRGDMRVLYRANYTCRTALSILKPFLQFEANSTDELYQQVNRFAWEKILDCDSTFMIDSNTSGPVFTHSYFAALRTKDAIADRFRSKFGRRPSVDTENALYKFNLHIEDTHVTLLFNSSGESLHKRGYRQAVGIAPINEVLAAGIIKLTGWKCDTNFYDPMCGSGTFLIEAAMLANNIPAQYYRGDNFAFRRWKEFNMGEWKKVKDEENRKIGQGDFDHEIWGNDIDEHVIEQAEKNLRFTKLHKDVCLHINSFEKVAPPEGRTIIVTNPPYGERIQPDDLNKLYSELGSTMKNLYGEECDAWVISSNENAVKNIGLHPTARIQLFNGALECRLLHYELYSGSRKESKKTESKE